MAPVLPVEKDEKILHYVLDPATAGSLQLIDEWAADITQFAKTYYFMRQSHWYIFPAKQITSRKWHSRNMQNRKWLIQCLAGINGLTKVGKARLMFNKKQVKNVAVAFEHAKKNAVQYHAPHFG